MCEYCEFEGSEGENLGTSGYDRFAIAYLSNGYCLVSDVVQDTGGLISSGGRSKPIKYCPMCGKKLPKRHMVMSIKELENQLRMDRGDWHITHTLAPGHHDESLLLGGDRLLIYSGRDVAVRAELTLNNVMKVSITDAPLSLKDLRLIEKCLTDFAQENGFKLDDY